MKKVNIYEDFFEKVYCETFSKLRIYIRRRVENQAFTDDILQEVYIEVFRHIENLKTHENYIGWVYKTAEYKIKKINSSYNRRKANEIVYDEMQECIPDVVQESDYIIYDEYRQILKQDEYELLMLKYQEGYSHKELAVLTGSTEAANKMRISRIVNKLKKSMKSIFLFILI